MTADNRWQFQLDELARSAQSVAELLRDLSVGCAAAGVPMNHVSEAIALGKRALALATAIHELANKAAPAAPRLVTED